MHQLLLIATLTIVALTASLGASRARPDDCAVPGQPHVLIEYRRTGGFAGFRDSLVIDETGHAVLTRRQSNPVEFDLDQLAVDELVAALKAAGFPENAGDYPSMGVISDGFTYVVTYRGATDHTETTAVPDFLQPILNLLDRIVAQAGQLQHARSASSSPRQDVPDARRALVSPHLAAAPKPLHDGEQAGQRSEDDRDRDAPIDGRRAHRWLLPARTQMRPWGASDRGAEILPLQCAGNQDLLSLPNRLLIA